MLRVPFNDLYEALRKALLNLGLSEDRAALSARLTAETDRDGIYTHGLSRFPRFSAMVRNGSIDPKAEPSLTVSFGTVERWDGHRGPGNLNAYAAMHRAIALAKQNGIGCVALGNTSHWMRGGTYGWLAAEAGLFAICWSNTLPNVPAWGAITPTIGNNPLIIAVPHTTQQNPGAHIVVDMAMSQFSYGTISSYIKRNRLLPVDGGFDTSGNLTRDPAAIEASQRALPVGYWKGSGLALVLDMIGAMLSGGRATHEFPLDPLREVGQSQIFLTIDPTHIASPQDLAQTAEGILASLREATPADSTKPVRYPGEQTLKLREENLRLGVPVDPEIWSQINKS